VQAPKSLLRIIYVSCGFKALEADTAMLLQGRWTLVHAQGHVFFPGSDHVESLAVFDRIA
jgi:tRNA/tmRNA/rRNA uracil-C5-methylase (TrmA/RlmC/RlmD family)